MPFFVSYDGLFVNNCLIQRITYSAAFVFNFQILDFSCKNLFVYNMKLFPSRLDQYAIAKFAESFEMIPKTLSENAGLNAIEIISSLYAEHASGNTKVGIDLEEAACKDVSTLNIWDLYITK